MDLKRVLDRLRWPLSIAVVIAGALGSLVLLQNEPAPPLKVVPATTAPRELRVYVSGAVVRPGVYTFSDGARVEQVVQAAGGPAAEADLDRLNLAVRLRDEMQVQVPYKAASLGAGAERPRETELINLNTASGALLETLPGIGPVTAQRILDHRQSNGPFSRIDELLETKLVSASTFEKIRGRITAP